MPSQWPLGPSASISSSWALPFHTLWTVTVPSSTMKREDGGEPEQAVSRNHVKECRLSSSESGARMAQGFSKQNQSTIEGAYRFGEFELYPRDRMLKRNGAVVALQ